MTSVPVKKALASLLRDPGNATCADCKSQSHPRWASWSLGVFICIKCAGVHRSLGTHISKVKSVDLDTWQEEHLRTLVQMGNNDRANAYYEAGMDPAVRASLKRTLADTAKLQSFIRTKYEARKWAGAMPRASAGANTTVTSALPKETSVSPSPSPSVPASASLPAQLGGKRATIANATAPRSTNSSLVNLEKLSTSISNSSAEATKTSGEASTNTNTNTNVQAQAQANSRPDLKKSILSLYSNSKPSHAATVSANAQAFRAAAVQPSVQPVQLSQTPSAQASVHSASGSASASASALSLDDDLFKNVWS